MSNNGWEKLTHFPLATSKLHEPFPIHCSDFGATIRFTSLHEINVSDHYPIPAQKPSTEFMHIIGFDCLFGQGLTTYPLSSGVFQAQVAICVFYCPLKYRRQEQKTAPYLSKPTLLPVSNDIYIRAQGRLLQNILQWHIITLN